MELTTKPDREYTPSFSLWVVKHVRNMFNLVNFLQTMEVYILREQLIGCINADALKMSS